jgi:L-ascorbate metabolism protein UlaG (beta-lactamase superfamily)
MLYTKARIQEALMRVLQPFDFLNKPFFSMIIQFFGESCFRIQAKEAVIVIDPFGATTGLRLAPMKADILLLSGFLDVDKERVKPATDTLMVIDSPGEYETKGVFVYALAGARSTFFIVKAEDIAIGHFAGAREELSPKHLEQANSIDIALVPIGGGEGKSAVLSAAQADALITHLEPRVVIPMNFHIDGLALTRDGKEKFLKEIGSSGVEEMEKYTIKKKDLPAEDLQVILLKP